MSLPQPKVSAGLVAEYTAFAELIAGLGPSQWDTPTRCDGWRVRHVAGHVTGQAADLADGVIGSRTPGEQASALAGHTAAELASRLAGAASRAGEMLAGLDDAAWQRPSPVPRFSMRTAAMVLWSDAWVHADDVRAALGFPPVRGPGLRAAFARYCLGLRERGWGPARLRLDGFPAADFGTGGPVVTGDPLPFVLAAAGRHDPATLSLPADVNIYLSELSRVPVPLRW